MCDNCINESVFKKKRKKHDKIVSKIVSLAKTKINIIEVLISKALIDSGISQNHFVLVNDMLQKYNDMNKALKNPGKR